MSSGAEIKISIKELLTKMIELGASDLHLVVGAPPVLRIHGGLEYLEGYPSLKPDMSQELIYSVMSDEQIAVFESERECDLSFGVDGLSRFRLNVYRDRGSVAAAFRAIPFDIRSFDELGLPRVVADFAYRPLGLVLVCGPTGSGKSTTLAAIIDRINRERNVHIITIEDPIEYLHRHQRSIINQREINADTNSFSAALKHVLRQDPDVILIGEMRDPETIAAALTVAETGHLAFATLHTNDALQTINRIVDVFPPSQQAQIRTQLSFVLEGVVVQQLVPRPDSMGRVVALEVMLPNTAIRSLIRDEKLQQIPSMIEIGAGEGMMTMNQSLHRLVRRNIITTTEAFKHTSDPDGLRRLMEKSS
ncbi:MAG TPA: type IV pilus twitching motility protein PilT [Candidatus Hydrogenedentes bacterium]|nr:type IV pilus twitching motility protein PilT [Candidatus Hydrogenedentota bacterium]